MSLRYNAGNRRRRMALCMLRSTPRGCGLKVAHLALMREEFARILTPELQRCTLLRTEYTGKTMRDNLRS